MKDLTRSTLLAVPLALLIYMTVLPHHGPIGWDLLDAFTLAFSFTYVGHWVEVFLLKIPDIETPVGKFIRVVGWFAGGLWCYEVARWLLILYGRSTAELPSLLWGAFFFETFCLTTNVMGKLGFGRSGTGIPKLFASKSASMIGQEVLNVLYKSQGLVLNLFCQSVQITKIRIVD